MVRIPRHRAGCSSIRVQVFGDTLREVLQPASFCIMPRRLHQAQEKNIMELIGLFGIVCSLVLSFIIANAGAKRQIGFGWSLFLGVWLTPIVSLIAVLLSDRLQPDEYGRTEKKWGCMSPFIVSVLIIGTVIYFFYSYSNKRTQRIKTSIELQAPAIIEKESAVEVQPKEAVDIVVDLNDYFNSSTGWDDNVDWNTTSIDDEEAQKAFDKVLEKNDIVYNPEKGAWVKRTIRAVQRQPKEESLKVKF